METFRVLAAVMLARTAQPTPQPPGSTRLDFFARAYNPQGCAQLGPSYPQVNNNRVVLALGRIRTPGLQS